MAEILGGLQLRLLGPNRISLAQPGLRPGENVWTYWTFRPDPSHFTVTVTVVPDWPDLGGPGPSLAVQETFVERNLDATIIHANVVNRGNEAVMGFEVNVSFIEPAPA